LSFENKAISVKRELFEREVFWLIFFSFICIKDNFKKIWSFLEFCLQCNNSRTFSMSAPWPCRNEDSRMKVEGIWVVTWEQPCRMEA
jgi:hypothetical protein